MKGHGGLPRVKGGKGGDGMGWMDGDDNWGIIQDTSI